MNPNQPNRFDSTNAPFETRNTRRPFQLPNNGDLIFLDLTSGQATTRNAVLRNVSPHNGLRQDRIIMPVRDDTNVRRQQPNFPPNQSQHPYFEARPRNPNTYAQQQIPVVRRVQDSSFINQRRHQQPQYSHSSPTHIATAAAVRERDSSPPPLTRSPYIHPRPRATGNASDDDQPPRLFPQIPQTPPVSHTPERDSKANISRLRLMRLRCKYRPLHHQYTTSDGVTGNITYLENNGDVEFICADAKLYAHRVVLCCASTFFIDMFKEQDYREFTHISVPDVQAKYLRTVLTLAYTPELKLRLTGRQLKEIESVMEIFGFKRDLFQVSNEDTGEREPRLAHPRKAVHMSRSLHRTATQPLNISLPSSINNPNPNSSNFSTDNRRLMGRQAQPNSTYNEFENYVLEGDEDGGDENAGRSGRGRGNNLWNEQVQEQPVNPNVDDNMEGPGEDFRCTVCRTRFTDPAKYQYHQMRHTSQGEYTCQYDNCGETFPSLVITTRHERDEHEPPAARRKRKPSGGIAMSESSETKRAYYDPAPVQGQSTMHSPLIHMSWDDNSKTSDNIFICAGCGKSNTQQEQARQHYLHCANCKNIRKEVAIEKRKRGFVGSIVCNLCNRSFMKNLGFTIHCGHKHGSLRELFNYDTTSDSIQCSTCHEKFKQPIDLTQHLNLSRMCNSRRTQFESIQITSGGSTTGARTPNQLAGSLKRRTKGHKNPSLSRSKLPYSRNAEFEYDPPIVSPTMSRGARLAERQKKKYSDVDIAIPMTCPICKSVEEHLESHLDIDHPDLEADVTSVDEHFLHCAKCNGKFFVSDLLMHLKNCTTRTRKRPTSVGPEPCSSGPRTETGEIATSVELYEPTMDVNDLLKFGLQCGICSRVEKRIADATQCVQRHGWFRCSICFSTYKEKQDLTKHEKTHSTSDGQFQCPLCGKMGNLKGTITHMHSAHFRTALREAIDPKDWSLSLKRSMYRSKSTPYSEGEGENNGSGGAGPDQGTESRYASDVQRDDSMEVGREQSGEAIAD